MIDILENNLKYEILYFLKHNIKSVNLAKIQNELSLDNEDFKKHCEKMKYICKGQKMKTLTENLKQWRADRNINNSSYPEFVKYILEELLEPCFTKEEIEFRIKKYMMNIFILLSGV